MEGESCDSADSSSGVMIEYFGILFILSNFWFGLIFNISRKIILYIIN